MIAFDRVLAAQEQERQKAARANRAGGAIKRAEFERRLKEMRSGD